MAELLIRGKGRVAGLGDGSIAMQAALAWHRARKVKVRSALKNQVHGNLDLVFPGLAGCFDKILLAKAGRLLLKEALIPERVRRLGVQRPRGFRSSAAWCPTQPKHARSSTLPASLCPG